VGKRIIPAVAVERLPCYYRYFCSLKGKREKVSSQELANGLRASASQVRLDLSYFGGFGLQGYGYRVNGACAKIGDILGIGRAREYVIVGAGRLGRALADSPVFQEVGFCLAGIFDIAPEIIGENIGGKTVAHLDSLESFLAGKAVRIGIIATPAQAARDVANALHAAGVRGILNFAPTDLAPSNGMSVTNINLTDKLLSLAWKVMNQPAEGDEGLLQTKKE